MGCNQSTNTTKVETTQSAVVANPSTRVEVSHFIHSSAPVDDCESSPGRVMSDDQILSQVS